MKKISLFLALAFALLPLSSCHKENSGTDAPVVFTLEASTPSAKTYMGEADEEGWRNVLWKTGDRIDVNGVLSLPLGEGEGGGTNAVFKFTEIITPPYNAVYPGGCLNNGYIDVPRTQIFYEGQYDPAAAIMLGKGDENGITFKNAMAYIRVTPKLGEENVKIAAIELESFSKKISGQFTPDYDNATLSENGDNAKFRSEIFFDEPVALSTSAIFAIPAQEYTSSIDITFVEEDLNEEGLKAMKKSSKGFTAKAGSIYSPSFVYKADVLGLPAALTLYGPGQPGGWDTGSKLENKGNGIYAAESINLTNGAIKIYRLNASDGFLWSEPFYVDTETKSTTTDGVISLRPIPIEHWIGDPVIDISKWGLDNGTYDVSVNLNEKTLTLTESSEVVYPEKLYLVGNKDALGNDHDWVERDQSLILRPTEDGVYSIQNVHIYQNYGQFKFMDDRGWNGEYVYNGVSDQSAHTTGIKERPTLAPEDDNPWYLTTFGFSSVDYYYNITVNLKTKVVSLVQGGIIQDDSPEFIYIPGAASPGYWDHPHDSNKLQKISPWVYSGTKYLNLDREGGGFKICTTTGWDPQYGGIYEPNTFDNGTMDIDLTNNWKGCDEVRLKDHGYSSGTYTITVDFNTMKLTISQ